MFYVDSVHRAVNQWDRDIMIISKSNSYTLKEEDYCYKLTYNIELNILGRLPRGSIIGTFWCNYGEISQVAFLMTREMVINQKQCLYDFTCYINIPLENSSFYRKPIWDSTQIDFALIIMVNQVCLADNQVQFQSNQCKDSFCDQARTVFHKTYKDVQNEIIVNRENEGKPFVIDYLDTNSSDPQRDLYFHVNEYDPEKGLFKYPFELYTHGKQFKGAQLINTQMEIEYTNDNSSSHKVLKVTPYLEMYKVDDATQTYSYRVGIKEWVSYDSQTKSLTSMVSSKGGVFIDNDCEFRIKLEGMIQFKNMKRFISFNELYRATKAEAAVVKDQVKINTKSKLNFEGREVTGVCTSEII